MLHHRPIKLGNSFKTNKQGVTNMPCGKKKKRQKMAKHKRNKRLRKMRHKKKKS